MPRWEWMYLFKPRLSEPVLYVKVILRSDCVLISFHEDEEVDHEEEDAYPEESPWRAAANRCLTTGYRRNRLAKRCLR